MTVGTGGSNYEQAVPRTATIDFPFRLAFDSQETFQMQVSNVTVYAKQQIDFVILNQVCRPYVRLLSPGSYTSSASFGLHMHVKTLMHANLSWQVIPRDGSNPTMTLGYTVQYPYAIVDWTSQTLAKTNAGTTANTITAAFDSTTPPVCALGDYIAVGSNTGGSCYKTGIAVTFTKNSPSDCSFDGQIYTASFGVQCATGLAPADCPLQAEDSGTASFTITSDNWYVEYVSRPSRCQCDFYTERLH